MRFFPKLTVLSYVTLTLTCLACMCTITGFNVLKGIEIVDSYFRHIADDEVQKILDPSNSAGKAKFNISKLAPAGHRRSFTPSLKPESTHRALSAKNLEADSPLGNIAPHCGQAASGDDVKKNQEATSESERAIALEVTTTKQQAECTGQLPGASSNRISLSPFRPSPQPAMDQQIESGQTGKTCGLVFNVTWDLH